MRLAGPKLHGGAQLTGGTAVCYPNTECAGSRRPRSPACSSAGPGLDAAILLATGAGPGPAASLRDPRRATRPILGSRDYLKLLVDDHTPESYVFNRGQPGGRPPSCMRTARPNCGRQANPGRSRPAPQRKSRQAASQSHTGGSSAATDRGPISVHVRALTAFCNCGSLDDMVEDRGSRVPGAPYAEGGPGIRFRPPPRAHR